MTTTRVAIPAESVDRVSVVPSAETVSSARTSHETRQLLTFVAPAAVGYFLWKDHPIWGAMAGLGVTAYLVARSLGGMRGV